MDIKKIDTVFITMTKEQFMGIIDILEVVKLGREIKEYHKNKAMELEKELNKLYSIICEEEY